MKKIKKFVAGLLAAVMVMGSVMVANAETMPQGPEGMAPVRAMFEGFGATVEWVDETRSIHINLGDVVYLVLFADENFMLVNGNELLMRDGIVLYQCRSFISRADTLIFEVAMVGGTSAEFTLTPEARDLALYDFDYALRVVLENSPWDSVIYRRLGFDFHEFMAYHRSLIYNMTPRVFPVFPPGFAIDLPLREPVDARSMAANYLISMLQFDIAMPLGGIGHLGPRDLNLYQIVLTALYRGYYGSIGEVDRELLQGVRTNLDAYMHPSAIWFYGEIEVDLDEEVHPFPNVPGNVVTEIIVPDEVAFIRFNSFLSNPEYDGLITLPFLQEVSDFNHLILDLRGNGGGMTIYFTSYVLPLLINEPIEVSSWEIFAGSPTVVRMYEAISAAVEIASPEVLEVDGGVIYFEIMPINDFLYQRNKPYFNQDDLERLAYVMVAGSLVMPGEDSVGFEGQIWMLIDGGTGSAASLAALMINLTGIGTLVGENTSGVMAATHLYTALPNTGIVWRVDIGYFTDPYGRSLEVYGITPDVFNFEGMDALETVLAIIAEGN
jgi:hypothetical protein